MKALFFSTMALLLASRVMADPLVGVNTTDVNATAPRSSAVCGYDFSIAQPITVTQLGVRDLTKDTKLGGGWPVPVWIWNDKGHVVLRGEVPIAAAPTDGIIAAAVEPTVLPPGAYFIGAMQRSGSKQFPIAKKTDVAAGITLLGGRHLDSEVMTLPDPSTKSSTVIIGPVFRFLPDSSGKPAPSDDLLIDSPSSRAVFQRDAKNEAAVPIKLTVSPIIKDLRFRVLDQKTGAVVKDWQPISSDDTASVQLAAGWYVLEVSGHGAGGKDVSAKVDRFGVGEVFLTAGQSNSANYGNPRQVATDDRISDLNWETGLWQHADDPQGGASGELGSAWPAFGNQLIAKYNVPIGLVCMGIGSTRVLQWNPTRPGTFYNRIDVALNRLKPTGARAFLWHQGESDAINGTSVEDYFQTVKSIIEASRKTAGFPLPWGIAIASYHPDKKATPENQATVNVAQRRLIAEVPNVFAGPETNSFHERSLVYGAVHFNDAGLKEHGRLWFVCVTPLLPKP